jgi:hypothetical protein
MKRLIPLVLLLCALPACAEYFPLFPKAVHPQVMPPASALQLWLANWAVDPVNGGPRHSASSVGVTADCTGLGTTPFNPSGGQSQACPFSDPRYLYSDPWQYANIGWVISGGDTVIFSNFSTESTAGRISGADSPNCPGGVPDGQFGCGIGASMEPPDVPSGTLGNPTILEGSNFASCGTTITYMNHVRQVPDSSKTAYLLAINYSGQYHALGLTGSQYVTIRCLDLFGNGGTDRNNTAYGIQAGYGSPTNGNIVLQDVAIHGFQSKGLIGSIGGPWTMTRVWVYMNGQTGLDFDPGSGQVSSGSLTASYLGIDWSGCAQSHLPFTTAIPIASQGCYDDVSGGQGDAIGTPTSPFPFSCNYCYFTLNTQDGPDFGHGIGTPLSITNSYFFGNMGGNMKSGPQSSETYINNLVVANCYRMSQPITGTPSDYNTHLSDFCRAAGVQNSAGMLAGGNTQMIFEHNTLVGYTGTVMDMVCQDSSDNTVPPINCSSYSITAKDNIVLQFTNGGTATMWDVFTPTVEDYNIAYNLTSNPWTGSHSLYTNPTLVNQPPTVLTSESQLDNFDFNILSSSPAKYAGVTIAGQTTDQAGNAWHSPPSMGGLEFAGTPTAAQPTFSPAAGAVTNPTVVTASTATSGCGSYIYFDTNPTPVTNQTTYTVTTAVTLYAYVHGCPGYADSPVSNGSWTIYTPTPPNVGISGSISISGSVTLQ